MSDIQEDFDSKFVTSVGLITSNGKKWGPNVMAAEWTMQISYDPPLIAVFIHPGDVTHENILESKEFGVNMVTDDQAPLSHLAGTVSKRYYDKLSDEHFKDKTYPAKKINVLMIKGCTINAECKLIFYKDLGDHTMFVGEVVAASYDDSKKPILYHFHRYFKVGEHIEKPKRKS